MCGPLLLGNQMLVSISEVYLPRRWVKDALLKGLLEFSIVRLVFTMSFFLCFSEVFSMFMNVFRVPLLVENVLGPYFASNKFGKTNFSNLKTNASQQNKL